MLTTEIALQEESWDQFYPDAQHLMARHHEEVADFPDLPMAINPGFFATAYQLGILRIYTLRKHGAVIGYAVFHVNFDAHHSACLWAVSDAIYVVPEERKTGIGLVTIGTELIRFADSELQKLNVKVVQHSVKVEHGAWEIVLGRLGYHRIEYEYAKRLDRGKS